MPANEEEAQSIQNLIDSAKETISTDDTPPNDTAIKLAEDTLLWILQENLHLESVDPDVEGGFAIYLTSNDDSAWIQCMNDGHHGVVITDAYDMRRSCKWSEEAKQNLIACFRNPNAG